MKTKRFRGNKPPPITAGIRKMRQPKAPKVEIRKHYSQRVWKNRCLNETVRIIDGKERWICYLCGFVMKLGQTTIDHFTPIAKGGTNHVSNLRPCCNSCNNEKADKLPDQQ